MSQGRRKGKNVKAASINVADKISPPPSSKSPTPGLTDLPKIAVASTPDTPDPVGPGSDEDLSNEEILSKRQRKEKKDLQAKIQVLKKSASKGDKKKKKETTEEIARLEFELNEKHDKELKELSDQTSIEKSKSETPDAQVETVTDGLEDVEIKENKVSKAQKRRDKKAEKEKERLEDIDRQEEENKLGQRHIETEKIKAILEARALKIKDIPSDGDCLFAGVIHQLQNNMKVSELRRLTSDLLLSQPDDFKPFLSLEYMEDSEFEDYCEKMATTPKWGGQVEITALSRALRKPIEVIQAEGPIVQVGIDEFNDQKPIVLTYHRHYYGLGEHYNSVQSNT